MNRNHNHLMPAKSILHDAGLAIVRTPLLWLFSAIYLLTYDVLLLWVSTLPWIMWFYLLLIPIGILAEAGEIRSVQLQYFSATESISQIIRFGTRRIGALIVVLFTSGLLALLLLTIIACPASVLLESRSNMGTTILNLSNIIAYPIMVFAQCAIIISGLPVKSSWLKFFHVLKKNPLTILAMVIVFGVLRYILSTIYPTLVNNFILIAGYLLVILIIEGVQAAFFTIAYLHYLLKEPTTIQPAQSPQSLESQVYKSNQAQVARPNLLLLIILGIVSSLITNFIIYGIIIFTGLGKTFNHGEGYIYALDLTTMFTTMVGIILGALFGPLVGIVFFKITKNKIIALAGALLGGVIPIILLWNII